MNAVSSMQVLQNSCLKVKCLSVKASCWTCTLLLSLDFIRNPLIVLAVQFKFKVSFIYLLDAVGFWRIKSKILCCSVGVIDRKWLVLFGLYGSLVVWYLWKEYKVIKWKSKLKANKVNHSEKERIKKMKELKKERKEIIYLCQIIFAVLIDIPTFSDIYLFVQFISLRVITLDLWKLLNRAPCNN